MNNRSKYTFIIPAYNAEATISRAISSITSGMEDYEILVAENGSDDDTSVTVEKIASQNDRIQLLHTEKGVSNARNAGIAKASGEWLIFVDADDVWITDEKTLDNLTDSLQAADIIICSYLKDDVPVVHDYMDMNVNLSGQQVADVYKWMLSKTTLRMTVWAKLYKRETVINGGIAFDKDLRLSEDADFLIQMLSISKSAAVSDLPVYRYCSDMPSVVRSTDKTRVASYLHALEKISEKIPDDMPEYTDFVLAHLNLICVHDIFNYGSELSGGEKRRLLESVLNHPVIKGAVARVEFKDIKSINKIPAFFFKHKVYAAGGLICSVRALQNMRKQRKAARSKEELKQ